MDAAIARERLVEIRDAADAAIKAGHNPHRHPRAERAPSGGLWVELDPVEVLSLLDEIEANRGR